MRVGDATFYQRFLAGLTQNRARTERALASLADGKQVRYASDDPVGARESLALRTRFARLAGFDRSGQAAGTALGTLDNVLGDVIDVLTEARSEAMAGASAPTAEANEIHADQIDSLRKSLLSLANTSQGERYLFGGTETRTTPFADDGTYSGNDEEVQAPIGTDETVGATIAGSRVFADGQDLFALFDDLSAALRDNRTDDVAALVPALSQAIDDVAQVRGQVGARLRRIEDVLVRHGDEQLELLRRIGSIEDADLAEVAVALQSSDTATAALSSAAARVLGRSLFDYLG